MATVHAKRYKNFILQSEPLPLADGQFGAAVVVADEDGHPLTKLAAEGRYATAAQAVDSGRELGKRWADEHELSFHHA